MKKSIGIIMVMLVVMVITLMGALVMVNKNHEAELASVKAEYEQKVYTAIKDCEDTETELGNLCEQVYHVMNDDNYELTIEYDGRTYTYSKVKDDGIFGKVFSTVSKTVYGAGEEES